VKNITIMLISLALMLSVSCRGSRKEQSIVIAGSTSLQPFAEMVAEDFMQRNPGLNIVVQGGGSTAGIQAVRQGVADIGTSSRNLRASEEDLNAIIIARDGLAVIVHPSNEVSSLSLEQVRNIFAGKVDDWSEVGGKSGPIRPVTREEGSGTRDAFQTLVMKKEKIMTGAMVQDSNGAVREVIANDPQGIGYMSLGLVNHSVKALEIDGVKATHENILNGSYPLVRPFLFVLKGEPGEKEKAFIDFVLSDEGQSLLESEGLTRAK